MNDAIRQLAPPVTHGSAPAVFDGVAPQEFVQLMRELGFRATLSEEAGAAVIRSATQGAGFLVLFGGISARGAPWRCDLTFQCWLSVDGTLPEATLSSWNRGKRFARLYWQDTRLVLAMDVLAAGGVGLGYLRAQCDLWNRLVGDLLLHLRQTLPVAPSAPAKQSSGDSPA